MTPEEVAGIRHTIEQGAGPILDYYVLRLVAEAERLREAISVALTTLNEFSDDTGATEATEAREVLVKALEYTPS